MRSVEIFVVTEVEALGEESLFQIPVDFGQEGEIRKFAPNGGDERRPEFFAWSWFVQVLPPGVGEDVVEQQHRHIAADAVTLHGDAQQGFASGVAVFRGVGVELRGVDPTGKIGVAPVSYEIEAARAVMFGREDTRMSGRTLRIATHEILRRVSQPGVVERDVVGHIIEDEAQAIFAHTAAQLGQPLCLTQSRIDLISAYRICRADDIRGLDIRARRPGIHWM